MGKRGVNIIRILLHILQAIQVNLFYNLWEECAEQNAHLKKVVYIYLYEAWNS
jgi:hypothetical protein